MPDDFDPAKFNPHDPAFLKDPYPTYQEFREHAPVYRVEPYEADWIFRYDDCRAVLEDKSTWVKSPAGAPPTVVWGPYGLMSNFPTGMFSSDPPRHEKLREALESEFMQAIQSAPQTATALAAPLLAAAAARGRFELIDDYALPLPASVLFTLLGIPNDKEHHPGVWEGLIAWQAQIAAAHDITQSPLVKLGGATSSMALTTFFEAMLLQEPSKTGLFGKLVKAFKNAGLSEQDVQVSAFDFVVAGYLSTTFIIGTGTRNLLENPDELLELRNNPALMPGALEEMMRYDGPVQIVDRMAAEDTQLGEHKFKKYDKVIVVVGSANRDPDKFRYPDRFLIARGGEQDEHLGFGWGIHHCIGAPLVRLVAPVAFEMLLEKFPKLALAGQPQWQTDPYLRAVTNLPLQF
jgi:cytochrome P450